MNAHQLSIFTDNNSLEKPSGVNNSLENATSYIFVKNTILYGRT